MSLETTMSDLPIPNRHPVLRRYLKDVLAWHGYVRFLGMPTLQNTPDVPLDDLYVGQSVSRQYLSPENEPAEHDLLNPVQMLLENRCMVVLGDPGSGKSTLINWFAWYLASGFENRLPNGLANALPVPIILRELSLNNVKSFSDLIDAALQRPVAEHLDREILYNYINNGSVLFLVDGLDELSVESRSVVKDALSEGMELFSQSFFLITSRIVGYDNIQLTHSKENPYFETFSIEEYSLVAAGRSEELENKNIILSRVKENVSTLYIAPFSDKQISQFAFNWYREQMDGVDVSARLLRDQFISSIFSDENTRRLSRTPHLLTMMALIFRKRAHLPNGRAILYDAIAQAYLESIDQARGLKDEYDWQSKKLWLAKVAFEMQLQRSLDTENEELLVDKAIVLDWIKTSIASFQHQVDEQYAEEFLSWIARRSGLLLPRGQDQYAFLHLSFQEYFSAVYIQSQLENPAWFDHEDKQYLDERVNVYVLANWSNEISWNQTLVFLFELMSKKPGWGKRIWNYLFPLGKSHPEISNWLENIDSMPRPSLVDLKWSLLSNRHCYLDKDLHFRELDEIFYYASEEQSKSHGVSELFGLEYLQNVIFSNDKETPGYINYLTLNYSGKIFNISGVDLSVRHDVLFLFAKFKSCVELSLIGCNIDNVEFISAMQRLMRINLRQNNIRSFPKNVHFNLLESADLSRNGLESVDFLRGSSGLMHLNLLDNKVSDFSAIEKLHELKSLHIDTVYERDACIFYTKSKLKLLSVSVDSQVVLDNIFECNGLVQLNLSGSTLVSINDILKLENLRVLNVKNMCVSDWSPVLALPKLSALHVDSSIDIDPEIVSELEARKVIVRKRPQN